MPALTVYLGRICHYRHHHQVRLFIVVAAACLLAGTFSHAQTVNLGDNVARPIPGAGHDYIKGLSETVNPANGNLTIKIDLPVPKGRGLTIPFAITYNSGEVFPFISMIAGCGGLAPNAAPCSSVVNPTLRTTNGWSDTFPYATQSGTYVSLPPYAPLTSGQPGRSYCNTSSSYNFYDPSGGSHMLGLAAISPVLGDQEYETAYACSTITYNTTNCFYTQESGFYGCTGGDPYQAFSSGGDDQVQAQTSLCNGNYSDTVPTGCAWGAPPFTVTDTSGTVYSFSGGCGGNGLGGAPCYEYPTQIEDRNGNILQVNGFGYVNPYSITDTLGRPFISVLYSSNSDPLGSTTYTVGGLNYVADWTTTSANFQSGGIQIDVVPAGIIPTGAACSANFTVNQTSLQVIQYLTLPNGQEYTFKYDPTWGLVNEIDYPDGGWVKYTWKLSDTMSQLASFSASQNGGAYPPLPGYCNYQYQTPVVATRTVGYSQGSAAAQTQQFAYYTSWGTPPSSWAPPSSSPPYGDKAWTTRTAYVITTDNVANESSETVYTYGNVYQPPQPNSVGQIPPELPVENTVANYDWGHTATAPQTPTGTPLETETKTWLDQFEMGSEQIALNNGQSSKTVYTYNSYSNSTPSPGEMTGFPEQVLEKDDYDYGTSPVLSRKTIYNYYWLDFPNQVITEDANGNWLAETDATYDGQTVTSVSGLPANTHDETNYGPGSKTSRGNPTTVTRKLNTGPSPTTTYTFDETGQVMSMTDPRGNTTTYSYADNYSGGGATGTNAYLTQITYPTVNGVAPKESFSYYYPTGYLASAKDENGQITGLTTNYKYADTLNRLTEIDYPDGGEKEISYQDSVPSVTTSTLLSSPNNWMTSVATMDGMGHEIETQLTTDPSGADTVVTTYFGTGHVHSKTNPYRTTSDPTYGVTSYGYDALGRVTSMLTSDRANYQTWSYTGNAVQFRDENGNQWKRTSDAFGRLTQVLEPNGISQTSTMETDYSYDPLNNLLSVSQWGGAHGATGARTRSFTYDVLSRLLTATNPETGMITYSYDLNGNVLTKTDARSVSAVYSYDVLNRITSKTYSNDASGTPWSCYQYDSSSTADGIGRLTAEWTQSWSVVGGCPPTAPTSGFRTKRSILAYDPMGRLLSEKQYTPANQSSATAYAPVYTYDLAGDLLTATNGIATTPTVGTLLFTNTFDNAQHLLTQVSNWNDATHPQSLFSAQSGSSPPCSPSATAYPYAAFGGLMNASFGSGLTFNRSYDNRLRTNCENDTGKTVSGGTGGSATVTITGLEQTK